MNRKQIAIEKTFFFVNKHLEWLPLHTLEWWCWLIAVFLQSNDAIINQSLSSIENRLSDSLSAFFSFYSVITLEDANSNQNKTANMPPWTHIWIESFKFVLYLKGILFYGLFAVVLAWLSPKNHQTRRVTIFLNCTALHASNI